MQEIKQLKKLFTFRTYDKFFKEVENEKNK